MSDEPTVVEANQFILRGSSGRKLAMLTSNDEDEAYLVFFGRDGQARVALGVTKDDESRLAFLDSDGQERINISFLPNGQTAVVIDGGPGRPQIGMRGGWDEGCGIGAWSGAGKIRTHIGIDSAGMPNVQIINPDGRVAWRAVKGDGTRTTKGGIILPTPPMPKPPVPPKADG
jgi:hypothetical protein